MAQRLRVRLAWAIVLFLVVPMAIVSLIAYLNVIPFKPLQLTADMVWGPSHIHRSRHTSEGTVGVTPAGTVATGMSAPTRVKYQYRVMMTNREFRSKDPETDIKLVYFEFNPEMDYPVDARHIRRHILSEDSKEWRIDNPSDLESFLFKLTLPPDDQ